VYVDDIVFGGSSHSLVARFAEDMNREFEMSMTGEFKMDDSKPLSTPMSTTTVLDADEDGVPEHDWLPLVLEGDEAGHPDFRVSMRSFLGITEDFTSAGRQVDLQVSSINSCAQSLVFGVLFPFASWFFRCRLCRVSS
jgi:hypothetical protein